MSKVIIIMGSKADSDHAGRIQKVLEELGVDCIMRIASAHKVPEKALGIIKEYSSENCVFITVAGMSNALSGFTDANTDKPVIACPPYNEEFAGLDVLSTLRMPSGVCPMTVLGASQAALAAVKILALSDEGLRDKVKKYQKDKRDRIENDDKEVSG